MSASLPTSDIRLVVGHVSFGPKPEVNSVYTSSLGRAPLRLQRGEEPQRFFDFREFRRQRKVCKRGVKFGLETLGSAGPAPIAHLGHVGAVRNDVALMLD